MPWSQPEASCDNPSSEGQSPRLKQHGEKEWDGVWAAEVKYSGDKLKETKFLFLLFWKWII